MSALETGALYLRCLGATFVAVRVDGVLHVRCLAVAAVEMTEAPRRWYIEDAEPTPAAERFRDPDRPDMPFTGRGRDSHKRLRRLAAAPRPKPPKLATHFPHKQPIGVNHADP